MKIRIQGSSEEKDARARIKKYADYYSIPLLPNEEVEEGDLCLRYAETCAEGQPTDGSMTVVVKDFYKDDNTDSERYYMKIDEGKLLRQVIEILIGYKGE